MTAGQGQYTMSDGRVADVEATTLMDGSVAYAAGSTASDPSLPVIEMGASPSLRLVLTTTAKAGSNPTLDVTVMTSHDKKVWYSIGTFAQKTDVGLVMSAVTPAGTTPPTITLTGTQLYEINLRVEALTSGALATWTGRFSVDGGVTWNAFTSAATVSVIDAVNGDSGIVLNIAAGNASTDNVWTAKTAGVETKTFAGCDRFVKVVPKVGGTGGPTFTATIIGERSPSA